MSDGISVGSKFKQALGIYMSVFMDVIYRPKGLAMGPVHDNTHWELVATGVEHTDTHTTKTLSLGGFSFPLEPFYLDKIKNGSLVWAWTGSSGLHWFHINSAR